LSNIDVSAVATAASSGVLQSKLTADITNTLTQQSSGFIYSSNESDVKNIVKNIINTNITTNSVNTAFAGITQSNLMELGNVTDGAIVTDLNQTNIAKAISSLMSKTTSDLQVQLNLTTDITNDTDQKWNNILDLIIRLVTIIGVAFICISVAFLYSHIIALILLFVVLAAYFIYRWVTYSPLIAYVYQSGGWSDGNLQGQYACPTAPGVDKSGNCSFNYPENAANWCTANSSCVGILNTGSKYVATDKPISGGPYKLAKSIHLPVSNNYSLQSGYWKDENKKGDYTCITAPNVVTSNKDYCVFTTPTDAEGWCSYDANCQGYLYNHSALTFQASSKIVPSKTRTNVKFLKYTK
jgi:hypothetical protein